MFLKRFFLPLLILLSLQCFSQDSLPIRPNALQISGTFDGELQGFYLRKLKNTFFLDLGFGHKWGTREENSWSEKTDQVQFYSGSEFFLGVRKYFPAHRHPFYVEVLGMYKNYYFDKVEILHIANEKQDCQVRSSHKQVYAAKLLLGKFWSFPVGGKIRFNIDVNIGWGLRRRFFDDTIHAHGSSPSNITCQPVYYADPLRERNSDRVLVSPQAALRFGIGF